MLYPLSYGGASGKCNDLRVNRRWQGVTRVDLGEPHTSRPDPILPLV